MVFGSLMWRVLARLHRSPGAGLLAIICLAAVSIVGNAITYRVFDGAAIVAEGGTPPSWGDALWYSIISITTIGYGDISASSLGARIGTVVFIVFCGLASFTLLVGFITDFFVQISTRGQRGMANIHDTKHIILANFPSEVRVRQLIREMRSDPTLAKARIIIISDAITELPFADRNIGFVHGSPLDDESLDAALSRSQPRFGLTDSL